MKKILAILFTAIVLATMLIGCSKSNSEPVTEAGHIHDWTPVYDEKQVLVKEAWDEDVYETKTETKTGLLCDVCGLDFASTYKEEGYDSALEYCSMHARDTGHMGTRLDEVPVTTKVKVDTIHHEAEYKTEKYIVSYECTCGATKNA